LTWQLVHQGPGGQAALYEEKDHYLALLGRRFGQRFREYRRKWALAGERRQLGSFPLSVDLALNSGCQLNCPMCPLPARPESRQNIFFPKKLYQRLLAEAREHALPALTLGLASEPLLCPDLPDRIVQAVRAGIMDIRLGTSGRLLNDRLIPALIGSGLTRLEISVDAVQPETYRAIRGGNLEQLERSIFQFLEIRARAGTPWPLLRVSFLQLELNQGELEPFLKKWSGQADLISVQKPIWFPGSRLSPPPPGPPVPVPCSQPWQRLGLDYAGRFWPCCSWYGENLLKRSYGPFSLARFWQSSLLAGLRQSLLFGRPPEECLACARAGAF
jgi:uncharacterized Fe-S cluster-containing radical SAM superfamily protein